MVDPRFPESAAPKPVVPPAPAAGSPQGDWRWQWRALCVLVLLLLGVALFFARAAVAPLLGLGPGEAAEQPPAPAVEVPPIAEPRPLPPPPLPGPDQLEAAADTVSAELRELIEAGRQELPSFTGLASEEPVRRRQMWNRFHAWGPIWRNRLAVIERRLPVAEAWRAHSELEPTFEILGQSLELLGQVPDSSSVAAGQDLLQQAELLLQELLPEAEEGDSEAPPVADPGAENQP